jgi:hypothetical protein
MSKQNIGDGAPVLIGELEEFDITKDRSALINAIHQYLITIYESATLVEKARLAAAQTLISRMPEMSDNMLTKVLETLSEIRVVNITSITGSGR